MEPLRDRVIVVTGASRGIGRALALGLAAAGARLVLNARPASAQALDEVARTIDAAGAVGEVLQALGDVTCPEDCETVIAKALERFGAVHALINNAGLGMDRVGPRTANTRQFYNVPLDIWRRMVDTNINGPFLMAKAAMPLFLGRGQGRIINVTTSYDTMLREGFSPYGPCKAAAEAMTVAWAKDLAGTGILVNALCPGGGVDTAMMPRQDFPDRSELLAPAVMVPPAVWLCSKDSDGVTGMHIVARLWDRRLPATEAFKRASSRMTIGDARPAAEERTTT